MIDCVIDMVNHILMEQSPPSEYDAGLFEHDPSANHLHLLREVHLTCRAFLFG